MWKNRKRPLSKMMCENQRIIFSFYFCNFTNSHLIRSLAYNSHTNSIVWRSFPFLMRIFQLNYEIDKLICISTSTFIYYSQCIKTHMATIDIWRRDGKKTSLGFISETCINKQTRAVFFLANSQWIIYWETFPNGDKITCWEWQTPTYVCMDS